MNGVRPAIPIPEGQSGASDRDQEGKIAYKNRPDTLRREWLEAVGSAGFETVFPREDRVGGGFGPE